MEIKRLAVLLLIIGVSLLTDSTNSQSLSCIFGTIEISQRQRYACHLSIENPDGWDNFTQINGDHLPGLSNTFVTIILRQYINSISQNIPQVICSQFQHVTNMDMSYLEIQNVDQNSFRSCRGLDFLRLYNNNITTIPENAFRFNTRLVYLDLEYNQLRTLPENIFEHQINLKQLELSNNPIESLPGRIFRTLRKLNSLYMRDTKLTEIDARWFETLFNLESLEIVNNSLTQPIPGNTFQNLRNLQILNLGRCNIREINPQWFRNMNSLNYLFLYENSIKFIPSGSFNSLQELLAIDFSSNNINHIADDAFGNLKNLLSMTFSYNNLISLNPQWFTNMPALSSVFFDYNSITSLPDGVFANNHLLYIVAFWQNNIRTLSRNSFGSLENVLVMEFEDNNLNSIDERVLLDTTTMFFFFFRNNICAHGFFYNFAGNRLDYIRMIERCTTNYLNIIATTTEPNANYNFFNGPHPGIKIFVTSVTEVHVALTQFNVSSIPMIEIGIGTENNTFSTIVRNGEMTVVRVSTPNILKAGEWIALRITWARNVITVWDEYEYFPFIAWTMEELVPINFFGLRSPQGQALWEVEPFVGLEPFEK